MKRLAHCIALVAFALAGCAGAPSRGPDAQVAFAGDASQYIVITVHNDAILLPRAGSTLRDYDAPTPYSATPFARRQLRALANDYRLREVDAWPIVALGVHCAVFALPKDVAPADTLRQLARDRRVESVQPLNDFDTLSMANDPYRGLQRNLDAMHVDAAHTFSRGEKVRVAVVDTGIDAAHPDLAGRIAMQRNFVDSSAPTRGESHGTAVAGVIAAVDNNREGITGVAPAASLLGLKACWPSPTHAGASVCNTFTLAKALTAAFEAKSDIVNLSLAGPSDPLLTRLVDYGAKRGVIYVGAMPPSVPGFPCNVPRVICVGSAGTSNPAQPLPQLFAPGAEVLTLTPQGRYDFLSGSSLAAASVSASIALLLAKEPRLTSDNARQLLSSTAQPADAASTASINVCAALAKMLGKNAACSDGGVAAQASD